MKRYIAALWCIITVITYCGYWSLQYNSNAILLMNRMSQPAKAVITNLEALISERT